MALTKQYLKSKPVVKVTFRMPKEAAPEANVVALVGEFNNWNIQATAMERLKNGSWRTTLELDAGREYQYRYLIDETTWENDWEADKYVRSSFGNCDNSVVTT